MYQILPAKIAPSPSTIAATFACPSSKIPIITTIEIKESLFTNIQFFKAVK